MKDYYYRTNCINSTAQLIDDMIEREREITWRTFLRHVPIKEIVTCLPSYNKTPHIKDDWAVTFHKSEFAGMPCYFITHSAIEYVFTR